MPLKLGLYSTCPVNLAAPQGPIPPIPPNVPPAPAGFYSNPSKSLPTLTYLPLPDDNVVPVADDWIRI